MKSPKTIVYLLSITLSLSLLSAAGNPIEFVDFDHDKNGFVTQEEFNDTKNNRMIKNAQNGKMLRNANNSLQFSDVDTNKDGKITTVELSKSQQIQRQKNMGNRNNKMKLKKRKGRNSNKLN